MPVAAPADKRFRRAQVKPTRRRRAWAARVIVVLRIGFALVFVFGGGYLITQQVAHARALHVDRIVIGGNVHLSTGDVVALLEGMRGEHVLHVDLEYWRSRVMQSPWVEDAGLRRLLPSTIEVVIRERQPIAIGRLRSELYLVDATGHVIDEYGPGYAQFDLPIVDGLVTPNAGEPLVDDQRIDLANRVIVALRRHEAFYKRVSQIDVSNPRDAVVLLDDDRALLHLGSDQFVERLQSYVDIASALREQVPEMEYVDLRYDSKVFVRPAGRSGSRAAH
jgi:cell division protein FtsQ